MKKQMIGYGNRPWCPMNQKNGQIRAYNEEDLAWILPLAEKYGETSAIRDFMETKNGIVFVAPHKAIMAQFFDEHGCCLAGLCGPEGMKDIIRLFQFFVKTAKIMKMEVHGHWKVGTWQGKLAEQYGFDPMRDDSYLLTPMGKAN